MPVFNSGAQLKCEVNKTRMKVSNNFLSRKYSVFYILLCYFLIFA